MLTTSEDMEYTNGGIGAQSIENYVKVTVLQIGSFKEGFDN